MNGNYQNSQNYYQDGSTGPIPNSNWNEIFNQATKNNDPKANALLELKNEISKGVENLSQIEKNAKEKLDHLEEEGVKFRENLKVYKSDLSKINNFLIAVLLFVSITFIVTTVSLFWSGILSNGNDKEIYMKYNDVFKNYSDQSNGLKDIVVQQKIEINNLKNELDILKAKNPYLK